MEENKPAQKLEIKIETDVSQGKYSNLAAITHQETNFIFDFIFVEPQGPVGKVFSRIITSPQHAKRFLLALQENVAKYEAHFGVIKAGEAKQEPHDGMNYFH